MTPTATITAPPVPAERTAKVLTPMDFLLAFSGALRVAGRWFLKPGKSGEQMIRCDYGAGVQDAACPISALAWGGPVPSAEAVIDDDISLSLGLDDLSSARLMAAADDAPGRDAEPEIRRALLAAVGLSR